MWGSKNPAFSLSFCGSWYAIGRERGVLRTPRSLSCFMGVGTQGEENVGFLEPHVLSPILWQLESERKRI